MVNGAPWRTSGRNEPPYCRQRSTSCAQAAGGVGHINSPYTRTRVPAAGKQGCTEVIVGGNTPAFSPNTLLINTLQAGGNPFDTAIFGYKNSAAAAIISDDVDNTPDWASNGPYDIPQNYDTYDDALYQNSPTIGKNAVSSSLDIDLSTMYGGDTYRFIIMMFDTWGGESTTVPKYTQLSTPGGGDVEKNIPENLRINFGVTEKPTGNVLNARPIVGRQSIHTSVEYEFLTIDLTLSADKKSVTHKIMT